jgi:imidazolonepropionase-like amidohydrolase
MKLKLQRVRITTAAAAAIAALLAVPAARAAGELPARDFAVKAGTVVTVSGEDFSPGVVVVRAGRIAAVGGADTEVPAGLPVVDASRKVLVPGFVEAHTQRGLDRSYEIAADASFVRITDGMNPASLEVEDARRNGITTMLVAPDDRAFLAGRAAIVHPQGISVDSMIVKQDAALKISLMPSPGSSRMGHLAKLRQVLDDTRRYIEDRAEKAKRTGKKVDAEPTREALVDLLSGRLPAIVYCPTAADVATCFALGRDYGFAVTPVVAPAAWRAVDLLKANNVRVIVPPVMEAFETLPDGTTEHVSLPRLLADAGIPFALTTDPSELGAQHPWFQAAIAVRSGVPRRTALAAVTEVPAKILGFGKAKGVIAPGADADVVVWDPERSLTISAATHRMRVDYNPYEGRVVKGAPELVFARGRLVVKRGDFVGEPGWGRFLKRGPR